MKKPKFFTLNYLRDLFTRKKDVVRCYRCKRVLKDPKSIKRGLGRVCRKKVTREFREAFSEFNESGELLIHKGISDV